MSDEHPGLEAAKRWAKQTRARAIDNGAHPDDPGPDAPVADDPGAAPPDGAELLDELRDAFTRYVAFADRHAPAAMTLWVAVTHCLPAFECAPRLVLTSPQKRCAKSRTLDIIAGTCHKPLATVNATVPAVFRSLDADHPPTLIIDEADTLFGSKRAAENNEDLRALLNAGHQRGRPALRCVGPLQTPTPFATFAMAALAGIGAMPDTITDRAINVGLRRRAPGEKVAQFRSRRDGPRLAKLRERLATWAGEHIKTLSAAEPMMPVEDRAADTWEPLMAVADAAGGHWPDTIRAACRALVDAAEQADEEASLPTRLLADIRDVFSAQMVSFLPSDVLVTELRKIDDAPWNDFDLTRSKLGRRLAPFGVKTAHNPAGTARGYRLEDFVDAFERYTRQKASEGVNAQVDDDSASDAYEASDAYRCQNESRCQNENIASPAILTPRTPSDAYSAGTVPLQCAECGDELTPKNWTGGGMCIDCFLAANDEERPP